jgi:MgsA AAA+ ATPase C terminal
MQNSVHEGWLLDLAKTFSDPWIANSLMQKAIRRGDVEVAQRAALSFHALRGSAIWRRLMIIAFEDVGLGSCEAVVETVAACADPAFRKSTGGNVRTVLELSRRLAEAPKDRSADHLIAAAAEHPRLESTRRQMAALQPASRLALVTDSSLPLNVRATAAWYASGLEWQRERRILGGDLPGLDRTYRELGVPEDLVNAVTQAARRTREPLTVLLPLIWLAAREQANSHIEECALPPAPQVNNIPLYAFDKHTRIGRQALDLLARENATIRAVLERYAQDRSGLDAVRLAAFHAEPACVKRRLIWPLAIRIESFGTETDLLHAGVASEGHAPLIQAVRDNLDHLNDLRARLFLQSRSQHAIQPPVTT